MDYIHQIFVRKKIFGKRKGAWSSPISFREFYFSIDDKEMLIENTEVCKCLDQEGEILTADKAKTAYQNMEKILLEENGDTFSSTAGLSLG